MHSVKCFPAHDTLFPFGEQIFSFISLFCIFSHDKYRLGGMKADIFHAVQRDVCVRCVCVIGCVYAKLTELVDKLENKFTLRKFRFPSNIHTHHLRK